MGFTESISSIRKEVLRAIEASSTEKITQMLGTLQVMSETIPIQHRILRQLMGENARDARRLQIHEAGTETCGWILGDDGNIADENRPDWAQRVQASVAFRRWLREGKGIQHISGNAGAGKSTLVGASAYLSVLLIWASCRS